MRPIRAKGHDDDSWQFSLLIYVKLTQLRWCYFRSRKTLFPFFLKPFNCFEKFHNDKLCHDGGICLLRHSGTEV